MLEEKIDKLEKDLDKLIRLQIILFVEIIVCDAAIIAVIFLR